MIHSSNLSSPGVEIIALVKFPKSCDDYLRAYAMQLKSMFHGQTRSRHYIQLSLDLTISTRRAPTYHVIKEGSTKIPSSHKQQLCPSQVLWASESRNIAHCNFAIIDAKAGFMCLNCWFTDGRLQIHSRCTYEYETPERMSKRKSEEGCSRRHCGRGARGTRGGPCCTPGRPPRRRPRTPRRHPAERAHLRNPRHATPRIRAESNTELDYTQRDQKEEREGDGVAFGDVVDLASGRVGEEPDGDLPLLAVAERLAGAAFVRHFGPWSGGVGRGDGDVECAERVGAERSGGRGGEGRWDDLTDGRHVRAGGRRVATVDDGRSTPSDGRGPVNGGLVRTEGLACILR